MATTHITIEFIDSINIQVTINGQSFQGIFGKPLRDETATKAIEQAHFDEIFDVQVISKGDTEREQAELKKFKKALQNKISASYNAQNYLNVMIKREPNEAGYQYYTDVRKSLLDHSKEAQLRILKEAKIEVDKKAAQGKISKKDLEKAAKHSGFSELLKAKNAIEAQGPMLIEQAQKKQKKEVNELVGTGGMTSIMALFLAAMMIPALIAVPALILIPVSFLLIGVSFFVAAIVENNTATHSASLFNKVKRLNPDFLDTLENELPVGPEPDAVIIMNQAIKSPSSHPAAPAQKVEIEPEVGSNIKRPSV